MGSVTSKVYYSLDLYFSTDLYYGLSVNDLPPQQCPDTESFSGPLTPREALVMELIERGLSTRLIAKRLDIRPRTVDKHVERALRKLSARSRIEAVAILRDRGFIAGRSGSEAAEFPEAGSIG